MKEVTAIITCEITEIIQLPDDAVIPPNEVGYVPPYTAVAESLKECLNGNEDFDSVDDANVKLVQYFVRDLPNDSEAVVGTP